MSRLFYHTMQDYLGNLLFGVTGTMRQAGTGTLATIYGDEALTVVLPNPMTNHPSFGSFKCYLGAGDFDFYMAKAGYTFETLTGVPGYGSMAEQDASAVAITGGTATFTGGVTALNFIVPNRVGDDQVAFQGDLSAVGSNRYNLYMNGAAPNYLAGITGIGGFPVPGTHLAVAGLTTSATLKTTGNAGIAVDPRADARLTIHHAKATHHGLIIRPSDADTGGSLAAVFMNLAGTPVGSISTTSTTTTYTTTSDARLKEDVTPLAGAVDLVRALNPVTFRWRSDGSTGHGFLAHEVQAVVPEAVTGDRDAVDEHGQLVAQGMDHGKLVPYLVSSIKELCEQVQVLQAKLDMLTA